MTQKLETLSVHAGCEPDPTTKARITPICQTASYVFDSAEHAANLFSLAEFGNIYTRIMNPTTAALEAKIAALEGGVAALGVASGHAAQFIVFHTLMEPGCEIVAAKKLYGGTLNQFAHSFAKFGWKAVFVDADDPAAVAAAITAGEDHYANTDLAAFAANLDSMRKIAGLLGPVAPSGSRDLVAGLDADVAALAAKFDALKQGDAYASYADVSADARKDLAAGFTAIAGKLGALNTALGLS